MQLSTLNRVIALFLIGGFVVVMATVAFKDEIETLLPQSSNWTGIFLAIALLSAAALAGTLVDALANLTICLLIRKWIAKGRSRARLFFCGGDFDVQDRWRSAFHAAIEHDPRYKKLANDDMIQATSASMFFRTAEKAHTEWLVQHYSMYHLSANFALVLIACAVWAFVSSAYLLGFLCIAGSYLLTTFAVDNYLHTYRMSFQNAYLALHDSRDAASASNVQTTHHYDYVFAIWRPCWTGVVHLPYARRGYRGLPARQRRSQLR